MSIEEEVPLLTYRDGYWSGIDGEILLRIPDILMKREVKAWLKENGYSTAITMEEGGARAQAYLECRAPAYWREVKHPRIERTSMESNQETTQESGQAD